MCGDERVVNRQPLRGFCLPAAAALLLLLNFDCLLLLLSDLILVFKTKPNSLSLSLSLSPCGRWVSFETGHWPDQKILSVVSLSLFDIDGPVAGSDVIDHLILSLRLCWL